MRHLTTGSVLFMVGLSAFASSPSVKKASRHDTSGPLQGGTRSSNSTDRARRTCHCWGLGENGGDGASDLEGGRS